MTTPVSDDQPAPPLRVNLHIGTMKAGTTFIQHALTQSAPALADDGVLFPIEGGYRRQIAGVRDVLGLVGPSDPAEVAGAWPTLRSEITRWHGTGAVVSVEQLSLASSEQVATIVSSFPPDSVHVVLTVRDLARVLPSVWQENVQNGLVWSWPEFCASVTGTGAGTAAPAAGKRFWQQHDVSAIVQRWANAVPPGRIHIVTVPPAATPAIVLWERFCAAVGISATAHTVDPNRVQRNPSLEPAAAEFMRRLNVALGDQLTKREYAIHVKRSVAKRTLGRRAQTTPTQLDPELFAWCRDRSERLIDDLSASGVVIHGDLQDLNPMQSAAANEFDPGATDDAEIAHAAALAAAGAVRELAQRMAGPGEQPGGRGGARRGRKRRAE